MKRKNIYVITVIILFVITFIAIKVFARDDEEPSLDAKIKMYESLLAEAKDLGADTSDAEEIMKQAQMNISAGFISGAELLVQTAMVKLLDAIKLAGGSNPEKYLTPGAKRDTTGIPSAAKTPVPSGTSVPVATPTPYRPEATPTPYRPEPTPTPLYPNIVVEDKGYNLPFENTCLGGSSIFMVEHIPLFWLKPEGFADLRWDNVETERGIYNWDKLDKFYARSTQRNLNLVVNILGVPLWDYQMGHNQVLTAPVVVPNVLPSDKERYMTFIKTAVERYDSDGSADSSMAVKIKYFQLGSEPDSADNTFGQVQWADTVENYAQLVRWTKQAMIQANPKACLILGGSSDLSAWGKGGEFNPITKEPFEKDGWFVELFDNLRNLEVGETQNDGIKNYFDGVDFHHYGGTTNSTVNVNLTYKSLDSGLDLMKKRLYEYGYKDISLWVTGNSIYTGSPYDYFSGGEHVNYVAVSEKEQAIYLVKSLIVPVSKGVKAVFWSKFIDDPPQTLHFGHVDTFYNYSGLLNGEDQTKKLSFYTYKLLAELLAGAKFNQVFSGLEHDVSGYAFVKNGRPCYIFWNDGTAVKTVRIGAEQGKIYSITSLVTGTEGQVTVEDIRADQGLLVFKLGSEPVFIVQK
jgi:hypothetical protein